MPRASVGQSPCRRHYLRIDPGGRSDGDPHRLRKVQGGSPPIHAGAAFQRSRQRRHGMTRSTIRLVLALALLVPAACAGLRGSRSALETESLAAQILAAAESANETEALERLTELQGRITDPETMRLISQARFRLACRTGHGALAAEALRQ